MVTEARLSILALDMATSTGWAVSDRSGSVTSGVQLFALARGESSGMRFLRFRRWLLELLEDDRNGHHDHTPGKPCAGCRAVDVIVYERASFVKSRAAQELLHGFAGILQETATSLGLELLPVDPPTVKRHATDKGNAKKPDMIEAAAKRWGRSQTWVESSPEDEADALCVLAWALDEIGARP